MIPLSEAVRCWAFPSAKSEVDSGSDSASSAVLRPSFDREAPAGTAGTFPSTAVSEHALILLEHLLTW